MGGIKDLLAGNTSPVHHEEICSGIIEQGSPLSRELRGEQSLQDRGHELCWAGNMGALKRLTMCAGDCQLKTDIKKRGE